MKKACLATLAFLVMVPLGAAQETEGYYPYSYARLNYVSGDVFIQRASDLGYEKGEVNFALVQGDKVGTEIGQAEVHFGRMNYLRINEHSQVEFALLPQEGDNRIKLHVLEGSVYLRASSLSNEKEIELHTPDASFYLLEEGLYRINVRSDRETEFFVHEGSAEAAGEEGSLLVEGGQMIAALNGRFVSEPYSFYEQLDSFDEWNRGRDNLLVQRSNTRYLPSDLEEYEEELGRSGRWVYERPYGYVWIPYGIHVDWRPYLYGRWVWYPVIGWNWVSSEPWGWSVYHYGRWHWRGGLGWYWIPHHRWRPAWVHWWWNHSYVGWCPLSWHNRPVVLVNNFFYDRHYDRYMPARNRALTVVHRNRLQAPRVSRHVVKAEQFGSTGRIALKAQQPSIRPVVNKLSPESLRAQKVLSKSNIRGAPKSYGSARGSSSSILKPGALKSPAKTSGISSLRNPGKSAVSGNSSAVKRRLSSETPSRAGGSAKSAIRTYPRSSSAVKSGSVSQVRSSNLSKATRPGGSAKSLPAKVSSPKKEYPSQIKSGSSRSAKQIKKKEPGSSGVAVRSGERIKGYSSSSRVSSSSSSGRTSGSIKATPSKSARSSNAYPSRIQKQSSQLSRSSSGSKAQSVKRTLSPQRTYSSSQKISTNARGSSGRSSNPALSSRSSSSRSSAVRQAPKSRTSSSISRPSSSRSSGLSRARTSVSRSSSSKSSVSRSVRAPKSSGSKSAVRSSSRSSSSSRTGKIKKKD